eukprot:6214308-Pleurochrysis_carterae.AAC.3
MDHPYVELFYRELSFPARACDSGKVPFTAISPFQSLQIRERSPLQRSLLSKACNSGKVTFPASSLFPITVFQADYDKQMREQQTQEGVAVRWDMGLNKRRLAYFVFAQVRSPLLRSRSPCMLHSDVDVSKENVLMRLGAALLATGVSAADILCLLLLMM